MANGKPDIQRSGRFESLLAGLCDHMVISNNPRSRFADDITDICPHCGADNSDCKGIDGPMREHGVCSFFGIDTGIRYEEVRCFACKRTIGKRVYYRLRFQPI